jgi:hypothetical protein
MSNACRFSLVQTPLMLAGAALCLALTGCGGGGGGSDNTTAKATQANAADTCPASTVTGPSPFVNANPVGVPPASLKASDYLIAQLTGLKVLTDWKIQITDPQIADPQKASIAELDATDNMLALRSRVQNGTSAELGPAPLLYYIKDGHVFQVDLKRATSVPVNQQLSTLGNSGKAKACTFAGGLPIKADASDSLLGINTVSATGNCNTDAPTLMVVRTNAASASDARALPSGVSLPTTGLGLFDTVGNLIGVPMIETSGSGSKLAVYSPEFVRLHDVDNGDGISAIGLVNGDAQNTSGLYVRVKDSTSLGSLRYLSWNGSKTAISQCLYAFGNSNSAFSVTDTSNTYVLDGSKLIQATGGTRTGVLANLPDNSMMTSDGLYVATNDLLVHQSASNSDGQILRVGKDGAVSMLVASGVAGHAGIVGTRGSELIYASGDRVSGLQSLWSRKLEAASANLIDANIKLISGIWERNTLNGATWDPIARQSTAPLHAVLYCKSKAGDSHCAISDLLSFSLSSGASVNVGAVKQSLQYTPKNEADFQSSVTLKSDNFGLYDGLYGSLLMTTTDLIIPFGESVWYDAYLVPPSPSSTSPLERITHFGP